MHSCRVNFHSSGNRRRNTPAAIIDRFKSNDRATTKEILVKLTKFLVRAASDIVTENLIISINQRNEFRKIAKGNERRRFAMKRILQRECNVNEKNTRNSYEAIRKPFQETLRTGRVTLKFEITLRNTLRKSFWIRIISPR